MKSLEDAGIDPATSRMLSERSTIWANPPQMKYTTGLSQTKYTTGLSQTKDWLQYLLLSYWIRNMFDRP